MENKEDARVVNNNTNCNVFTAPVYGASFPLPGSNVTINQYYGKGQKPKGDVQEGEIVSKEAREKRKTEIMKAITDRFDFSDEQLGRDYKNKKITNDRLATLFRKCFGLGYIPPTAENRIVIEQLWVLLIDERNQCPKDVNLGYIPQTVLNIIGYFKQRDLVSDQPRELARVIVKEADTNLAKNVSRGISSPVFPEGTADMLDHYIDKLMEGEY